MINVLIKYSILQRHFYLLLKDKQQSDMEAEVLLNIVFMQLSYNSFNFSQPLHLILSLSLLYLPRYLLNSTVHSINKRLKLARPKNRAKTVQFSKQAVICERDGELCLIVRAVNLRNSLLIDVSVTGLSPVPTFVKY